MSDAIDAIGALAHGITRPGAPNGAADILSLTVGNQTVTGWQRVSVTRPLAAIPASFSASRRRSAIRTPPTST